MNPFILVPRNEKKKTANVIISVGLIFPAGCSFQGYLTVNKLGISRHGVYLQFTLNIYTEI